MLGNSLTEEYFWGPTMESILNEVKNNDPQRFAYLRILGTGSYYEGTDNKQCSDFDLMLVMDDLTISESTRVILRWDRKMIPNMSVRPGFAQVQLGANESLKWVQVNCVDPQGNLISSKVREWFGQLVMKAVGSLGYQSFVMVTKSGPAVNLKITSINGRMYSVDLTLAIKCLYHSYPFEALEWMTRPRNGWPSPELIQEIITSGFYLVAKAASCYETANGSSWRLSFSEAEMKLFWWPANAASCRNEVLRNLKALIKIENWHPLTSYHMKTILLYESEDKPHPISWGFDQWSNRLFDCLSKLEFFLTKGFCPNYFMKDINLFESFSPEEICWLAAKVHQLKNFATYQPIYPGFWLAAEPSYPKQSLVRCKYPLTPPSMACARIT